MGDCQDVTGHPFFCVQPNRPVVPLSRPLAEIAPDQLGRWNPIVPAHGPDELSHLVLRHPHVLPGTDGFVLHPVHPVLLRVAGWTPLDGIPELLSHGGQEKGAGSSSLAWSVLLLADTTCPACTVRL